MTYFLGDFEAVWDDFLQKKKWIFRLTKLDSLNFEACRLFEAVGLSLVVDTKITKP